LLWAIALAAPSSTTIVPAGRALPIQRLRDDIFRPAGTKSVPTGSPSRRRGCL
jgi:hypothetical protein